MPINKRLSQLSRATTHRRVIVEIDGKRKIVEAPRDMSNEDIQRDLDMQVSAPKQDTRPKSFWQGVLDEGAHGIANTAKLLGSQIGGIGNPAFGPVLSPLLRFGGDVLDITQKEQSRKSPYQGSTGGRIVGGVAVTAPTMAIPGGPFVQGAAQGAMLTPNLNDKTRTLTDIVVGGLANKAGDVAGRRIVAPVARRVVDTAKRATGKTVPALTRQERAITRFAPDIQNVRSNVQQAADLGLPYSLADADPRLRTLAGSVARVSPEARNLAEQTFAPRAAGQADRAIAAIDEHLAPITDIEVRGSEIRRAAQAAGEPFYTAAALRAAPIDEELAAMLNRPATQDAMSTAFRIAQNEGIDPLAIGFNLDDQGNVVLQQAPSFQTLQLIKRGLDAKLAPFRNPVTGKLNLEGNPEAASINNLLQDFNRRLGSLNPDYAAGNAAYSGVIRQRDALNLGRDLAAQNVPMRTFQAGVADATETTLPELQRGYATAMADAVNRARLSSNPYNTVYGSPLQQEKVGALFPGADKFGSIFDLETQMAKTAQETLGGSPTQARAMADQLFSNEGPVPSLVELISSPKTGLIKAGVRAAKDRAVTGGARKAAEIAPALYKTEPQWVLDYIDQLLRNQAAMRTRERLFAENAGAIAAPIAGALGVSGAQ